MVCEITPEMVEKFFGGEDDPEYAILLGPRKTADGMKIALELQGDPPDIAAAEIVSAFAMALYCGFSVMKHGILGIKPPKGLPIDELTAASEKLAEIATRRLEDAIRKFSKKP